MLTKQQLETFEKNGFLKGDVVLRDEEVDELRKDLDRVMEGKSVKKPVLNRNMLEEHGHGMAMTKRPTVIQIVNMWMTSDAYLRHAANPTICEEVAQLCRTTALRIWHDQVQYKPPLIGGPGNWHQDHPAWPIIQPADLVSAWVALDDATVENGCMWMVPGSHKWGNQSQYISDTNDFKAMHNDPTQLPDGAKVECVPFEIKKGQVGYHHCLTWHGSGPNRSQRKRRAIAVHYMPEHIRFEPSGHHPMEDYIMVPAGERLTGESFPLVYERDK
ncbi:phytanoyl-CoA dioxygenase family protein [Alicyclobacillus fastidiosus]|uniref:Phytanoyl-CoA dioxygenase family protein n=1 Tax=Alicyclobacillus fastidiosus TaxID=392011 RepID=A0ABY6ZML0_9BACL|nr:phytanoyl-CoA dioxygenase family protein [Alicyclobacillus fastidiosus]WAH43431.1 phytanoyl-CoA dioxygenase family protein [Alicyclobacillus fastidiosus]GMA59583.1 hypothetical protein GCM10025859_00230 [Alicyclobacillus fastidiosus]GMA65509.1 hypothetical protein GCM10025859_59490 [Alicyclobacillus fastidiosus]